jgi:hypothetical protein
MTQVQAVKMDFFLECNQPLALLALWQEGEGQSSGELGTSDCLSVWEDGEMRAIQEGRCPLYEYFLVVPVLRAISAHGCLWRVLEAAGMSCRNAEQMKAKFHLHWCLPTAFYFHPQCVIMMAKLESYLCRSYQVEASEMLGYLPQPDSCKWVHDRANHINSCTESLGVLISKGALACNDSPACTELAAGHAKAAAARHHSPQKVMHAQAALGDTLIKRSRGGTSSEEIRKEAAASLDEASKAATKMRLGRYLEKIESALRSSQCTYTHTHTHTNEK